MKKLYAVIALALAFGAGAALSAPIRDWQDIDAANKQVNAALHEVTRIRIANHSDTGGHLEKAEQHLKNAMNELDLAIETARKAK